MSTLQIEKYPSTAGKRLDLSWLNLPFVFLAMLLLMITAFWVAREAENTLEENLKSKLVTILGIETEAIKDWLESQKELAIVLAKNEHLTSSLIEPELGSNQVTRTELTRELDKIAAQVGTNDCLVVSHKGVVLATNSESTAATEKLLPLDHGFQQQLLAGRAAISQPFRPLPKQPDDSGLENDATIMIVAAPIRNGSEQTAGFLCFGIRPLEAFTRILRSSQTGRTGETFVFNGAGQQMSGLRFRLASDSNNEVHGDSLVDRILQANGAASAQTQVDLSGYRDYQADLAIGVGRWLPKDGFGIITKMNRAEAKAPIVQIRRFLWLMSGLLMVSLAFTFSYRWYIFRLSRAARAEELRQKRLGPYVLEEKIGEGGMGKVYRAKHALLLRPTAVKILPPEKSSPKSIARFEQEVHLTSRLKHPNTISIYDFGRTENGLFFYAMEYLEGIDLEKFVHLEAKVPPPRVIHILLQVCASLHEAHQAGLVHRDIKPANIMLCSRGGAVDLVKVLDFGMVRDQRLCREQKSDRTSQDDGLSGTPLYMAPEAFTDPLSVDRRADIFAVGAVGFFLLAGKTLFEGQTLQGVMQHHLAGNEFSVEALLQESGQQEHYLDRRLVQVIGRCLASNPGDRFQNVDELRAQLAQCHTAGHWSEEQAAKWWEQFCPADLGTQQEDLAKNALAETLAV